MNALVLAAWLDAAATAQDGAAVERFLAEARAATARYHDRSVAIAEGYRLIGRDFPGMGEHWIHIGSLFDGGIEAARPEMLTYATVAGAPRLTGACYITPLLAGETPPDFPVGREAWHDHAGTLEDETLRPHHHHAGHAGERPRLAMVHAWIWLDNPAGTFAADNWAIPYLRLGLEAPPGAPPAAAKALSLLGAGADYYEQVVARAADLSAQDRTAVRDVFTRTRRAVARVLEASSGGTLTPGEVDRVGALWREAWTALGALVGGEATQRLEELGIP